MVTGIDLLAWTQMLLLDGELVTTEPKRLRYRLLHVAGRITRSGRRTRLWIAASWPTGWAVAVEEGHIGRIAQAAAHQQVVLVAGGGNPRLLRGLSEASQLGEGPQRMTNGHG